MAASATDSASARLRPGVFGPTVKGGKPRNGGPDWMRVAWLALITVLSFAVLTAGTYAGLLWYEINSTHVLIDLPEGYEPVAAEPGAPPGEGDGDGGAPVEPEPVADRTTILLVGSDSREGLTREQLRAIGTEQTGTDLTDTIILLQVDPQTDVAVMLSFPRDLVVTWCTGGRGRINKAYYIGETEIGEGSGPACLVNTIEQHSGIHIDHYARINFAGFVRAIDALGGVTFYIEEPMRERYSGLDIPSGCVEFDGVRALQFVRARRLDSDFGRIARQQRFAREMLDKATSVGFLARPDRVTDLIGSISDTLETDENFGLSEMADILNSVRGVSSGGVEARTVPAVEGTLGEASVVYEIEDEAQQLYRAFQSGGLLPDNIGTSATPQQLSAGTTIPIVVDNANGPDERADTTQAVLEALGFTVADVESDNTSFRNSQILYPPYRQDHARILSEALGGIQSFEVPGDGDQLRLILGSAFDPLDFAPPDMPDPSETPTETEAPDPSPTATETEFVGAALSDVEC